MTYTVQFFRDDKLYHSRAWDLGLDSAKQHATGMTRPYDATSARVLDRKGREVFSYIAPPNERPS